MIITNNGNNSTNNNIAYEHFSKQLGEQKKANANLRKKIKAKDRQIHYLFNCIDQLDLPTSSGYEYALNKSRNLSNSKNQRELATQAKKYKQNSMINNAQNNIFKQVSSKNIARLNKQDVRLPSLDKKNIHLEQTGQNPLKQKTIKVPIQKLIPLKPEEVKKKFQMKYKIQQ